MCAQQADLQPLALKLIFDNFSDCDYRLGNDIVSDVMVIWASKVVDIPCNNYNDNPTFSEKAREQKNLWDILRKWSNQYWAYYERVKDDVVEEFSQPVFNYKNPCPQSRTRSIRKEILDVLETQDVETAIELMAILIVETARRLAVVPENVKDDIEDFLYFTDTQFQLA